LGDGRTQPEAADGHVAAERAVIDGQDAALVEYAAALRQITWSAEGLILRHDHLAQAQAAARVPDAAAIGRKAMRDRQVVDGHGNSAADLDDAAGVVAADAQPVSAWAVDGQIVRDAQLTGGQDDRAVASRGGEGDQVRAGEGVGVEDRLPQGTSAALGEVIDHESAGDCPVFQPFHVQSGISGTRSHDKNSSQRRCGLR
jgi:hypothetical protein